MLLDNEKLTHWNVADTFERMFTFEQDYQPWICLKDEPRETIGLLESVWNDFDKLDDNTKMIHNTRRRTQPWKAGLPIDWRDAGAASAVRRICVAWSLQAAPGSEPGTFLFWPAERMPGKGHRERSHDS